MKLYLVCLPLLSLGLFSCNADSEKAATSQGIERTAPSNQKPTVARTFVTAENTNQRLTEGVVLEFQAATQPLETEIAVFVNPGKTFQSFLGIGGAITDASAEVFSMLSSEKQ